MSARFVQYFYNMSYHPPSPQAPKKDRQQKEPQSRLEGWSLELESPSIVSVGTLFSVYGFGVFGLKPMVNVKGLSVMVLSGEN